jgi:hypothetical protein
MAARNKPAGIRSLVYGMGKGKAVIEGLSVSRGRVVQDQAEHECLFGRFLPVADRKRLIDTICSWRIVETEKSNSASSSRLVLLWAHWLIISCFGRTRQECRAQGTK